MTATNQAGAFDAFLAEVEAEAEREGPAAVAELADFDARFWLANQFLTLRQDRGLTQRQVARRAGLSQGEVSLIERGVVDSRGGTLRRVARALDAHVVLLRSEDRASFAKFRESPQTASPTGEAGVRAAG